MGDGGANIFLLSSSTTSSRSCRDNALRLHWTGSIVNPRIVSPPGGRKADAAHVLKDPLEVDPTHLSREKWEPEETHLA